MFGFLVSCLTVTAALVGSVSCASESAAADVPFPPAPTLSSDAGQIVAGAGSFCWTQPGQPEGLCADTIGPVTSKRPLVVRPGESIRVDLKIAARSLFAALVPRRGLSRHQLGVRALDPPRRHWRVRLPAHLPRGWLLSLFATYPDGDASFGARLSQAPTVPRRKRSPAG